MEKMPPTIEQKIYNFIKENKEATTKQIYENLKIRKETVFDVLNFMISSNWGLDFERRKICPTVPGSLSKVYYIKE